MTLSGWEDGDWADVVDWSEVVEDKPTCEAVVDTAPRVGNGGEYPRQDDFEPCGERAVEYFVINQQGCWLCAVHAARQLREWEGP